VTLTWRWPICPEEIIVATVFSTIRGSAFECSTSLNPFANVLRALSVGWSRVSKSSPCFSTGGIPSSTIEPRYISWRSISGSCLLIS